MAINWTNKINNVDDINADDFNEAFLSIEEEFAASKVNSADEKIIVENTETGTGVSHAPLTAVEPEGNEYWIHTTANTRYGESACDADGLVTESRINIPILSFDKSGHINQAGSNYITKSNNLADYDEVGSPNELATTELVAGVRNIIKQKISDIDASLDERISQNAADISVVNGYIQTADIRMNDIEEDLGRAAENANDALAMAFNLETQIGDIDASLAELHTYAQTLIGGDSV